MRMEADENFGCSLLLNCLQSRLTTHSYGKSNQKVEQKLTSLLKLKKEAVNHVIYYTTVLITRRMTRRTSVARERMKVSNRESSSSSPIFFDHQFLCTFIFNSSVLSSIPCWFESRCLSVFFFRVFSFVFLSTYEEESLILEIWNGWVLCMRKLLSDTCLSGDQLLTTIQSFVCFPTPYIPDWSLQCVFLCLLGHLFRDHLHCDFERCSTHNMKAKIDFWDIWIRMYYLYIIWLPSLRGPQMYV